MVQKRERCGQRTGNTLRKHFMSLLTQDGYIDYKVINTPHHFEPERLKKLFSRKDDILLDGRETFSPLSEATDLEFHDININFKHREGEHVTYSLDKQKRWTLSSWVNDNIESLSEEDFRVVVSERKTFTENCKCSIYGSASKFRTWNDCVRYTDSKTPLQVATPNKAASFFCDLRRKCLGGGRIEQKTRSRQRKRHNMHSRGIQRKCELQQKTEKVNNEQEYNRYQLLDGSDSKDMAEFRYEICLPQGMKSRYNSTKAELYERASDKLPYYYGNWKKSLPKVKGMVNGCRSVWKKLQLKERLEENNDFMGYSSTSQKGFTTECRSCLEETNYSDEVVYTYSANDEDACCVPKKNTIEVNISDCLKKERQKQKAGHQQKRGRKRFSDEVWDGKDHIVYINEDKTEGREENSSVSKASKDSPDILPEILLPPNVECFFKRAEMEDFLGINPSFYSTSSHPTIFVIPLETCLMEDENKNVSFDGEDPALILQEKLSSAASASADGIAECRLRIVGSEEIYSIERMNRDLVDFVTSKEELLILSLGEVFHFVKGNVQPKDSHRSLQNLGQPEPCALESVFDWLPRVTYSVTTIKQALLQTCDLPREVKQTLPPPPNSLTGIANNDFECGVCFVSLCDTDMDSGGSGLTGGVLIQPCQHYFCRTCLFQYVLEKIRTGARNLSCLEYKCESMMDPFLIMSLVPSHVFGQWSSRKQEQAVMSTGLWKWCPNKTCNLIVSLSEKDQRVKERGIFVKDHIKMRGVTCLCHTEFCMECEEPPHWPATCKQIGEYFKALNIQKDLLNEDDYVRTFKVNVKPCPRCREKVDKNGGCNAMTCRCGHHFCWLCLRDNPYGVHSCKEVPLQEVELVNSKVVKFQTKYLTKAFLYRVQSSKLIRWRNTLLRKAKKDKLAPQSKCTHIRCDQLQNQMCLRSLQQQYLNTLVETVKLSENILVSMGSLSRKSGVGKQLLSLTDLVDFIISRMSELLRDPIDAKVYRRIEKLNSILSKNIKQMVLLSSFVQQKSTVNMRINIRYSVGYD